MNAMILAAGKGERMLPLTNKVPKPLLEVHGKPLIVHHLQALARLGICSVVINIHHLGAQIVSSLGDGSAFGVKIHYSMEEQLLNTGGGIVKALPYLGEEPFLVLSADIYTDFPYNSLPKELSGLAHLVMVDNPSYHPHGDFSIIDGTLGLEFNNRSTYANIGIYKPEFFRDAPSGAFGLGDLLKKNISLSLVSGHKYNGFWHNVGTPEDLSVVNTIS